MLKYINDARSHERKKRNTTVDSVSSLSQYYRPTVHMLYQHYIPGGCGFCYMLLNYNSCFGCPGIAITTVCVTAVLHSNLLLLAAAVFPFNQTQAQWPLEAHRLSNRRAKLSISKPAKLVLTVSFILRGGKDPIPKTKRFGKINFPLTPDGGKSPCSTKFQI
jgi:hypothetical protein